VITRLTGEMFCSQITYIYRLRIDGLVPSRIEVSHTARQVSATPVPRFYIDWILRNTIVDPINSFYKFL